MNSYKLLFDWQISMPDNWQGEYDKESGQYIFYPDNSDLTIRITPFHAERDGILAPREVDEEDVVHPLKEVRRVATKEDDEREAQNRVREREAFKICQKKIREHGLEMKLIDAEYTFDNNKVLFYFTADGRIDFRQLVKDLAAIFKTRIELRQIGVRDETKIL